MDDKVAQAREIASKIMITLPKPVGDSSKFRGELPTTADNGCAHAGQHATET